ncbi:hypothetical protein ACOSP7_025150 [Xanthoceras sorbifolium]
MRINMSMNHFLTNHNNCRFLPRRAASLLSLLSLVDACSCLLLPHCAASNCCCCCFLAVTDASSLCRLASAAIASSAIATTDACFLAAPHCITVAAGRRDLLLLASFLAAAVD